MADSSSFELIDSIEDLKSALAEIVRLGVATLEGIAAAETLHGDDQEALMQEVLLLLKQSPPVIAP